jgi:uncharacterized membrane protein YedE/YeeE
VSEFLDDIFDWPLNRMSLSVLVRAADATNFLPVNIRTPKTVGVFPFDANIVGGALQGFGTALSASCPATVFVQAGLGASRGLYTLLGCVLGGIVYVLLAPRLQVKPPQPKVRESAAVTVRADRQLPMTLHETVGVHQNLAVLAFVALSILIVYARSLWATGYDRCFLNSLYAGAYIGVAHGAVMLLVHRTVGVSTSFEDVGKALTMLVMTKGTVNKFFTPSIKFAGGIFIGTLIFTRTGVVNVPGSNMTTANLPRVPLLLLGGAAMVFGARLAGGCTSGHGISGIATLSVSSFVTIAAMYAGGVATAALSS